MTVSPAVFAYGTSHPDVVFIGAEEYLEGPLDLAMELRTPRLVDRVEFHLELANRLIKRGLTTEARRIRDSLRVGGNDVWRASARLLAGLQADSVEAFDRRWEAAYEQLGRSNGRSLQTELYPLPKKGLDRWSTEHEELSGFTSHARWYSGYWPRGNRDAPRAVALRGLLADLPRGAFVIQYTRGAANEMWQRSEYVMPLAKWKVVVPGKIEIASAEGLFLARSSAFSRRGLTLDEQRTLLEALLDLRANAPA